MNPLIYTIFIFSVILIVTRWVAQADRPTSFKVSLYYASAAMVGALIAEGLYG